MNDEERKDSPRSQVVAAILGLFAAIKICRREGRDVHAILVMVEKQTDEWGLLPEVGEQWPN